MTTIDSALDAHIDANELAGTPSEPSTDSNTAILSPVISADYYNLTETDGWPIAGLVVLLDRHHIPVRAEVHLYDNTTGRRQDEALHNANQVLITNYRSESVDASQLPLRVMRTRQVLDTLRIQLDVSDSPPVYSQKTQTWPGWLNRSTATIGLIALLVAATIITTFALVRNNATLNQDAATPAAAAGSSMLSEMPYYGDEIVQTTAPAMPEAAVIENAVPAEEITAPAAETESPLVMEEVAETGTATPPTETSAADYVNPFPIETNGLAGSQVAHSFELLDQAQVSVGHLALQREPDPDRSFSFAWKPEGTAVQIMGGPFWRAGDTGTIEWWYVETSEGEVGWMASNGSTIRFLEPIN